MFFLFGYNMNFLILLLIIVPIRSVGTVAHHSRKFFNHDILLPDSLFLPPFLAMNGNNIEYRHWIDQCVSGS